MEYEMIHNSIRQQQYRLGIVKRTLKPSVKHSNTGTTLYTVLLILVLGVFPIIASIEL